MTKALRTHKMLLAANIPVEDFATLLVVSKVCHDGSIENIVGDIITQWKSKQFPEMVDAGKRLAAEWQGA